MKRLVACAAALVACACFDFDAAVAECRRAHRCEDPSRPPTLVEHSPAEGALDVPVPTRLSFTFDEPMAVDSVQVRLTPSYGLGAPAWSENDTRLSFPLPPGDLEPGRSYTVTVEGNDLGGTPLAGATTFAFTTGVLPDTTRPGVVGTEPPDGATSYPLNGNLLISFSERMQPDTASALLALTPSTGCTYSWQSTDTVLVCHPVAPLQGGTQYSVTVTAAARDLAGNPAEPYTFHFITSAAPDVTPPTVVSASPAPNAAAVDKLAPVVITFSEPMDRVATEASFQATAPTSVSGTFSWDVESTVLTFTPSPQWPWAGAVQYRVGTGAKDLAGNALSAPYQGAFTVEALVTVTLTSVASLDGQTFNSSLGGTTATASGSTFTVGDDALGGFYRGFVSFDLSSLPAGVTNIGDARLALTRTSSSGTPTNLGPLRADSVAYGASLTSAAWNTATLQRDCLPPCTPDLTFTFDAPAGAQYSVAVTDAVQGDVLHRAERGDRSQLRIRRSSNANGALAADQEDFAAGENLTAQSRPKLIIQYEAP